MHKINETEIHVFIDAIGHYFNQISNEIAIVKAAYLASDAEPPPLYDYLGTINLSGDYQGSIYFSAPRILIRHLLIAMQEPNRTEQDFLDAVGEIANTLAGNARKHFGEFMSISVPTSTAAPFTELQNSTRIHPFVIMIKWRQYHASLVIDMERIH
jgi:chemotaxis protein CheX